MTSWNWHTGTGHISLAFKCGVIHIWLGYCYFKLFSIKWTNQILTHSTISQCLLTANLIIQFSLHANHPIVKFPFQTSAFQNHYYQAPTPNIISFSSTMQLCLLLPISLNAFLFELAFATSLQCSQPSLTKGSRNCDFYLICIDQLHYKKLLSPNKSDNLLPNWKIISPNFNFF